MKIDKTEREFLDAFVECDHLDEEDALAVAAALDLEFKEEEPELPKRVEVDGKGASPMFHFIVPEGVSWVDTDCELDLALAREAAARYNAVESILRLDRGYIHLDHIGRVLDAARRKLQCAKT